jgi:hypothetical protein
MNYPDKFDLNDINLGLLIIEAAMAFDNQIRERKTDYSPVKRLAKILRETSRKLRTARPSNVDRDLVLFFNEIYPSKENMITSIALKQSKKLVDLSEELLAAQNLPRKRIRSLKDICIRLAEATKREHYQRKNSY